MGVRNIRNLMLAGLFFVTSACSRGPVATPATPSPTYSPTPTYPKTFTPEFTINLNLDQDGDGLKYGQEKELGTDPFKPNPNVKYAIDKGLSAYVEQIKALDEDGKQSEDERLFIDSVSQLSLDYQQIILNKPWIKDGINEQESFIISTLPDLEVIITGEKHAMEIKYKWYVQLYQYDPVFRLSKNIKESIDLLEEKILPMLENPKMLTKKIMEEELFATDFLWQDDKKIWVLYYYPDAKLRENVQSSLNESIYTLLTLKDLFGTYPKNMLLVSHGFRLGHMGGIGAIYMEDQESSKFTPPLTYESFIHHEIGHSLSMGVRWIDEGIADLADAYVTNMKLVGSEDPSLWKYSPRPDITYNREDLERGTTGFGLFFDTYKILGRESMLKVFTEMRNAKPNTIETVKDVFMKYANSSQKGEIEKLFNKL